MSIDRRNFIKGSFLTAAAMGITGLLKPASGIELEEMFRRIDAMPPDKSAGDEEFWGWVQQQYTSAGNIINFNNAGVNPQPKIVQEAMERYNRLSNEAPSYYMWQVLDQGREPLRQQLADLAGCSADEIAINRNSTEALETLIFGFDLTVGDEVVLSKQDYPNMINAWKLREKRHGVKLVWVDLPLPMEDELKIVNTYQQAFTQKTRLVQLTHMINWTGQILPVKKIAQAAHLRGIDVLLDGAQTFGHIDFKIPDTECDYFGTSLHKWLGCPFGTGLLYIRKEKIKYIWPLFASGEPLSDNIRKFESLGTRSFPAEHAIGQAIKFHSMIGSKRKEERFRFLKNYWTKKTQKIPGVKVHLPLKPEYSCGIALFSIEGKTPADVQSALFKKYGIHSVSMVWENISGVRISPNLYNTTKELDLLVKAIEEIAKS